MTAGLFLPTLFDLVGWAGAGFAALVFIGLGRLLTKGQCTSEVAFIAGWGAVCLVLTLWGVATPLSMRIPAWVLAAAGGAGLLLPSSRLSAAEWRAIGRLIVVALPLIAVMLSARPSQPDTFLNILPNAAYIYDHGFFPGLDRPPASLELPAAPYNLQLAGLIAGLLTSDFPANVLIALNLVLLLAAGLLLARLAAGEGEPGWVMVALGLLLATALNPGFVPRYHLSGYTETPAMAALAFAGLLAAKRSDRFTFVLLALSLAALVETKQDSFALAVGVVVAVAWLPLTERVRPALGRAILVALPAAALYLVWRWYALTHFEHGAELVVEPIAHWNFALLPTLFRQMLGIMAEKIFFFGILIAVLVAFLLRARRGFDAPGMRETAVLLTVTLVYNAALVVTYIVHFSPEMAADAHSYFRYNTHLALLLMAALVPLVRPWVARYLANRSATRRNLAIAAIAVMLLTPFGFIKFLRFDLEAPQLRAWELAAHVAPMIGPADRVAFILPGDNGSLTPMLEVILRLTPPRRPDITIDQRRVIGADPFAGLESDRWAILSCAPPGLVNAAAGQAALFRHDPDGWHLAGAWPYLTPPQPRASQVVAFAPLCL